MHLRYVLVRLGYSVVIILFAATITFLMFRLLPGDVVTVYADLRLPPELQAQLRRQFGLDQPLLVQYRLFLANAVRGDFGRSFHYNTPAFEHLRPLVRNSLILAIPTVLLAYLFGSVVGALLAVRRGTRLEIAVVGAALTLRSAPVFWTGMLAIMLFALRLGWLPHAGMRTAGYTETSFFLVLFNADFLGHLVLPLGVGVASIVATPLLLMRTSMLEVLHEDFVDMARAKGLSEQRVILAHAARNALLPVVTSMTIFLAFAVGGQVVVEYVFSWPGVGREILAAVDQRDYPVAQAGFLLLAIVIIVMNFVADVSYSFLDPRIVYN